MESSTWIPSDQEKYEAHAWQGGYDTGLSSIALVKFLVGQPVAPYNRDFPKDPDDLGRCLRALEKLPFLVEHLQKAKDLGPVWAAYLIRWDLLKKLYHEEEPSGNAPLCYAAMTAIQDCIESGFGPDDAAIDVAIESAMKGVRESEGCGKPPKPAKTVPYVISDAEREMIVGKSVEFVSTYLKGIAKEYASPCRMCGKKREACLHGRFGPTKDTTLCDPCYRKILAIA